MASTIARLAKELSDLKEQIQAKEEKQVIRPRADGVKAVLEVCSKANMVPCDPEIMRKYNVFCPEDTLRGEQLVVDGESGNICYSRSAMREAMKDLPKRDRHDLRRELRGDDKRERSDASLKRELDRKIAEVKKMLTDLDFAEDEGIETLEAIQGFLVKQVNKD